MDTEHVDNPSAEELAAEQADSTLPTEDEVRSKLAEDLGLDAEDDADKELLDKVVKREMDGRKKLSDTIRSKINWREKATKKPSQQEHKPSTATKKEAEEKDLSTEDFYALQEAKVPFEDLEEVKKASKLLGKPIPEVLKDDMVQAMLKRRQEHRASAQASDPGGSRSQRKGVSDQEILEKAKQGEVPKPGSPEAEALFRARRGIKQK